MTWTRIVLMETVTALKRLSGDKAKTFFVSCSFQRTIILLPASNPAPTQRYLLEEITG